MIKSPVALAAKSKSTNVLKGEFCQFIGEGIWEYTPLVYRLEGNITPKARPKLTKDGRAYLPENYRNWKDDAITKLRTQKKLRVPIDIPIHISITIGGKQRGDIDNIAGSLLDALVQADILADDRLAIVSKLTIEHNPALPLGANIAIAPPPPYFYSGARVCRSNDPSKVGEVDFPFYDKRLGMVAAIDWISGKTEIVSMNELEIAQ